MKLFTLSLLAMSLIAQTPQPNRYFISAGTTALTIQQPSSNANQVQFESASIYCASASTATPSWNGTAATATTGTIKKAPGTSATPKATAWTGSNVGAGTTGPVYNIPAAQTMLFDLSNIIMGTTGTATNFTFTTNNSCTITIYWVER